MTKLTSVACASIRKGAQRCNQLKGGAWKTDRPWRPHQIGRHFPCDPRLMASRATTFVTKRRNCPVESLKPLRLIGLFVLLDFVNTVVAEETVTFCLLVTVGLSAFFSGLTFSFLTSIHIVGYLSSCVLYDPLKALIAIPNRNLN